MDKWSGLYARRALIGQFRGIYTQSKLQIEISVSGTNLSAAWPCPKWFHKRNQGFFFFQISVFEKKKTVVALNWLENQQNVYSSLAVTWTVFGLTTPLLSSLYRD